MTTATITPQVPGPPPMPIIGGTGNTIRFLANPIAYMKMLQRDYGPIARTVATPKASLVALGPDYNRQILSDADGFYNTNFLFFPVPDDSPPTRLNSGIIMINGDRHRRHRRLMMPAFHKQAVANFRDTFVEQTEHMLAAWKPGTTRDIATDMKQLTLHIASITLFGLPPSDSVDALGPMLGRWLNYVLDIGAISFPRDLPGTPYRNMLRHAAKLEAELRALIASKRAQGGEARDVMAMLIQARDEDGSAMSEEELIGNASVIFTAGHETTAYTLTWAMLLLDQHPAVAANLYDELHGLLAGNAPTIAQLGQLPLLDRVVKEVLRVLPAAPASLRVAQRDFELGPYTLPLGTTVMTSSYITHHMPDLYTNASHFDPSRWETITPGPYEYLPFNSGPRMCIGVTFALIEMKIVLAMLVQRFRPTVAPGAKIDYRVGATISAPRGLPMKLLPAGTMHAPEAVRGSIRELVQFAPG